MEYFLAVDFDGTIAERDVTDTVLTEFASPEWVNVEKLWQSGVIGSQECLARQMALVDATLETVLAFVEQIAIDRYFPLFVRHIRASKIPFAVISDGFSLFIQRILIKAGLFDVPVFANQLAEENGRLRASFTNNAVGCPSGTCKCFTAGILANGLPVVLIGDGRSDFCLADRADYVFAKGKLAGYCQSMGIPHTEFGDFREVVHGLRRLGNSNVCRVG